MQCPMGVMRGMLSSLGAGASLVVAAVLGLAFASSLIAFRGFPELSTVAVPATVSMASGAGDGNGASVAITVMGSDGPPVVVDREGSQRSRRSGRDAAARRGRAPAPAAAGPARTESPQPVPHTAGSGSAGRRPGPTSGTGDDDGDVIALPGVTVPGTDTGTSGGSVELPAVKLPAGDEPASTGGGSVELPSTQLPGGSGTSGGSVELPTATVPTDGSLPSVDAPAPTLPKVDLPTLP